MTSFTHPIPVCDCLYTLFHERKLITSLNITDYYTWRMWVFSIFKLLLHNYILCNLLYKSRSKLSNFNAIYNCTTDHGTFNQLKCFPVQLFILQNLHSWGRKLNCNFLVTLVVNLKFDFLCVSERRVWYRYKNFKF